MSSFAVSKIQLVLDRKALDERDIRLLVRLLAKPDLLYQTVQTQAHGRLGHAVNARDLLERTRRQHEFFDERHVLLVQRCKPPGITSIATALSLPFHCNFIIILNYIKVNL